SIPTVHGPPIASHPIALAEGGPRWVGGGVLRRCVLALSPFGMHATCSARRVPDPRPPRTRILRPPSTAHGMTLPRRGTRSSGRVAIMVQVRLAHLGFDWRAVEEVRGHCPTRVRRARWCVPQG